MLSRKLQIACSVSTLQFLKNVRMINSWLCSTWLITITNISISLGTVLVVVAVAVVEEVLYSKTPPQAVCCTLLRKWRFRLSSDTPNGHSAACWSRWLLDAYPVLSTIHEAAVAALFSMLEPYCTHKWCAVRRFGPSCCCAWSKTRRMSYVLLERVRLHQCSDSNRVTRDHPFQLSRVYIAQRIQYCIPGTTCAYFVIFCQNTAHKIIRNDVLSACVRMHTFRLYDVTEALIKRCSFSGDIQIIINY